LTAVKPPAGGPTTLRGVNLPSLVLHHRSTWSLDGLSAMEWLALIDTAGRLKQAARTGAASAPMRGKQLALVGDGDAGGLLRDAASQLGAKVTQLRADGAGSMAGSTRLLGRLYDAVDCAPPASATEVEREAGIPVFNGLGGDGHPARALAALLALREAAGRPLADLRLAVVGDVESPFGQALSKAASRIGFQLLIVSHADAAEDADFVLDTRDPTGWTLCDRDGRVHGSEREHRRLALQALLVSTLA
jgi:ornithine carbamoyltransferase